MQSKSNAGSVLYGFFEKPAGVRGAELLAGGKTID